MSRFSQHWEMPNGATVGDWLGTAAIAATQAGEQMERVRASSNAQPIIVLEQVEILLTQALNEIKTVRAEIGAGSP